MLEVNNLVKKFIQSRFIFYKSQEFTVINNISFKLNAGEILGLLGPNGAGKTTIIHMLLGITVPTSGTISYFGLDFNKNRSTILEKVTFASTYVNLPSRLTVKENLDVYGHLYGIPSTIRKEKIKQYLKIFDMWQIRDKEMGVLSAGESALVMLAKAFLPEPKIVLLDEPTASLDPDIALFIRTFIIKQQKEYGTSILITSHNMAEVSQVCTRALILKKGNIIADDTPKRLAASVSKASIYLTIANAHDREKLTEFGSENNIPFAHEEYEKNNVIMEVEEDRIAAILQELSRKGITYTNISIRKPTLEDYFIEIALQG